MPLLSLKESLLEVLLLAVLLSLGVTQASADTITVFDASGTFADGSTLSGTIDIDVTTGVATGVDLTVSAPDSVTFTVIPSQHPIGGASFIEAGSLASHDVITLGVTGSLVGYDGGALGSSSDPGLLESSLDEPSITAFLDIGQLTPEVPSVPEHLQPCCSAVDCC
jgi:hypothetical protein